MRLIKRDDFILTATISVIGAIAILFAVFVLIFTGAGNNERCGTETVFVEPMKLSDWSGLNDNSEPQEILAVMRTIEFGQTHVYQNTQSIYAAYSNYSPITHIGTTTDEMSRESMYGAYVRYMLEIAGTGKILTYSQYLDYVSYWEERIPGQFVYAMFNESLKQEVPMEYIYAIAYIESLNFQFFESLKRNSDGSFDVGLMGLNNANYDMSTENGQKFIQNNFRFDNEYEGISFNEHNQLHILKACIRYYKSLISYTGGSKWSALVCYNGGPSKWRNGKASKNALTYAERVYNRAKANVRDISNPWDVGIEVSYALSQFVSGYSYYASMRPNKIRQSRNDSLVAWLENRHRLSLNANAKNPLRSLYDLFIMDLWFDRRRMIVIMYDFEKFLPDEDGSILLPGLLSATGKYILI